MTQMRVRVGQDIFEALVRMPLPILQLDFKIRQRIWSYVVQEQEPFFFTDYKPPGSPPQYIRERGRGGDPRAGLALALVSKQFENEVIPLLYGVNIFSFDRMSAMDTFLRSFDRMRRYMRHIEVASHRGWKFVYSRTFFSMWPMANLRSITVDYRCIDWQQNRGGGRDQISLEGFFHEIKFFLRNWRDLNRTRLNAEDVSNLIEIVGEGGADCPLCSRGSYVCKRSPTLCKLRKENMVLARKSSAAHRLRKMIALDLDIPL